MKLVIPLLLVLFIGCKTTSLSETEQRSVTEAILAQHKLFQQAVIDKDTLSLDKLYAEGSVSLRQNEPVTNGRTQIMNRWKRAFKGAFALSTYTDKIEVVSSQAAYQYGRFEVHSTGSSRNLLATGKWTQFWKLENGAWKIALEMDNFDAPKK